MNIHEYQSKQVLKSYGVNVPNGKPAFSVEEAVKAAEELGSKVCVVKAQIHAGGRGKAGGVKLAKSIDEVKAYAKELLGKVLVTHQTGPDGKKVNRLLENMRTTREFVFCKQVVSLVVLELWHRVFVDKAYGFDS